MKPICYQRDLPNGQARPIHAVYTEIILPDRMIRLDLLCSETHLKEFKGQSFIYEPDVIAAIVNFVKPGDICIDAGANLGYHSVLMAKLVGKGGQVLAFEPDPDCLDKLKNNFAFNDVTNICFPIPLALWDGNIKDATFYLMQESGYGSFVKFLNVEQTEIGVDTVALDSVMNSEAPIRCLKIDCEGSEEGILHGAKKLLKRGVDAVIVEFNFSISKNDKAIREYMDSLGYDLFFLFDSGQMPEYIAPNTIIQRSEHRFHFNGLFSKRFLLEANWKIIPRYLNPDNLGWQPVAI